MKFGKETKPRNELILMKFGKETKAAKRINFERKFGKDSEIW